MAEMKREYVEKIYAGWLAKIIGIRLGAPVEGWSREQIQNIYGEPDGYVVDYRDFAADDDSNGPLFFLRALEDSKKGKDMTAQDVGEALLNYAPFEHGFFWWGGYGISTEHTAYLNLSNGIPAPRSGSIEQNGATIAEQIGGQIFIDTWGLVCPGNPDQAAAFAREAASVTHGGNGVYGGMFVAACISEAFVEQDIIKMIEKGLSYIPENCEYTRAVRAVMEFYQAHPKDWRKCFDYVEENFGYRHYSGVCHIIPNICVMILALLYGEGDFDDTLNIANRCGWDTDCNVGNIATIMGVRGGLQDICYSKWRKPVNDLLICSSVVGSLNIMDIPYGALYIAALAAKLAGEELPGLFGELAENRMDSCHFEFPGSTHAIRVRRDHLHQSEIYGKEEYHIENTEESAASGERSLKVTMNLLTPGEDVLVYKKTYYRPADFHDSRYDPSFSPVVYPGQTIHGSVMLPSYGCPVQAGLYVHDSRSGRNYKSDPVKLTPGEWVNLVFQNTAPEDALIDEMGWYFSPCGEGGTALTLAVLVDDLYADGKVCYTVDSAREEEEIWTLSHREITQFTRLKGLLALEEKEITLSCADFGEAYTGRYDWTDYRAAFTVRPVEGECHQANVRVQGARRSYAAALLPGGRAAILKKDKDYRILAECPFAWEKGREYRIEVTARGNELSVSIDGKVLLQTIDRDAPWLSGSIGISVRDGSRMALGKCHVESL